ncbi:MAG: GDSL-type esterase/lipase family protein, partial [Candidatus Eisenbacteria bacterium]
LYRDRIALFPRYVTDVHYGEFHIRGNVPDSHYWHKSADGRWEFFINGQGFRDTREFSYEKPEGELRVLVLGDSFTVGYESAQDKTYAAILERYLDGQELPAEIINAGMSGSSTAEALILLEQEGVKYGPDVVVLGYYTNDLDDNLKTDLYRLVDGELVVNRTDYVPAIRVRNFLNSFGLYRFLSEHSYLHNYLNNVATVFFKQRLLDRRVAALEESDGGGAGSGSTVEDYRIDLGRALVRRVYEVCQENGAEFVLLDIGSRERERSFPWRGDADIGHIADTYVDMSPILKRYEGLIPLRVVHGDGHWTPFSHLMAGTAIGDAILETHRSGGSSSVDIEVALVE